MSQLLTLTLDEFQSRLIAQNVPRKHYTFICPMCGTLQSATDLIKVGAGENFDEVEKYLAFSCIGRWTHANPPPVTDKKGTQIGCNWTLGGLFSCHDLVVLTPDDTKHPRFLPATPEQAQHHLQNPHP